MPEEKSGFEEIGKRFAAKAPKVENSKQLAEEVEKSTGKADLEAVVEATRSDTDPA